MRARPELYLRVPVPYSRSLLVKKQEDERNTTHEARLPAGCCARSAYALCGVTVCSQTHAFTNTCVHHVEEVIVVLIYRLYLFFWFVNLGSSHKRSVRTFSSATTTGGGESILQDLPGTELWGVPPYGVLIGQYIFPGVV